MNKDRKETLLKDFVMRNGNTASPSTIIYFKRIAEILSEIDFYKCYTLYDIDQDGFDSLSVNILFGDCCHLSILIFPHDDECSDLASVYVYKNKKHVYIGSCQIVSLLQHFNEKILKIIENG